MLFGLRESLAGVCLRGLWVELGGAVSGYAERLPAVMGEMLCEQDDLAYVMGVVSDLAVDGLHDGVRLAADGDGAGQVCV